MNKIYKTQDPKYGIKDNKLCVMATGEFIPEDEPVFMFRAKDRLASEAIGNYASKCCDVNHRDIVTVRLHEFNTFSHANPHRMNEPDTAS